MAAIFHYGPYSFVSMFGMPPGATHSWSFGPWPWYANAVTVTAHPLHKAGEDRTLEVTEITVRAAPNGDRFVNCRVRNVGPDPANYAIWLGGVAP